MTTNTITTRPALITGTVARRIVKLILVGTVAVLAYLAGSAGAHQQASQETSAAAPRVNAVITDVSPEKSAVWVTVTDGRHTGHWFEEVGEADTQTQYRVGQHVTAMLVDGKNLWDPTDSSDDAGDAGVLDALLVLAVGGITAGFVYGRLTRPRRG